MGTDDRDLKKIAENYVDILAGEIDPSSGDGNHFRQQAEKTGIAQALDFTWALAGKLKAHKKMPPLTMPAELEKMLEKEGRAKISRVISFDELQGLAAAGDGEKFDDF